MFRLIVAGCLALVMPAVVSAALVITEVMPGVTGGTPGAINGDWWELTNTGPLPVDLDGYSWADTEDDLLGATPSPNIFPAFNIGVGQSIIMLDEVAANEAQWRTNWSLTSLEILSGGEMVDDADNDGDTFSGLSGSGDAVFLYSPGGALLDSYVYGSSTSGVTFEASTYGSDLGLSVVGENGAYMAANGDVGSPGTAVPEPTTILMTFCGAALAMSLRRAR